MAAIPPHSTVSASSWRPNDPLINFQRRVVPHIPRAWERAPHKPSAPQHRGRKVWKRYNLRSKEPEHSTETSKGHDDATGPEEEFADTDRPIKRQCITNAPENAGAQLNQKPPKYVTTLRARAPGTPRRKLAKRKSLKSDRRKSVAGQISEGTDIPFEIARALKESEDDTDEHPASELDVGHSDAMDSCADGEGADEALQGETLPSEEPESLEKPQELIVVEADEPESVGNPQDSMDEASADNENEDAIPTTPKTPAEVHNPADISLESDPVVDHGAENTMVASLPEKDCGSPGSQSTISWHDSSGADVQNDAVLEPESLHEQNSENIDQSPPKDTLSASSMPAVDSQASELNIGFSNGESEIIEPQMSDSPRSESPARDEESIDQSWVVETLALPTSKSPFSRHRPGASPNKSQTLDATQPEAESSTVGADTNPSVGDTRQPNDPPTLPQSRTRSGTRFSDDTTLLKDFLNRARAHKAAKATPTPSEPLNTLDTAKPLPSPPRRSPRRSPRKALFELDRNSPSPTKSRDVPLRLGTPPGEVDKHVDSNNDGDDDDDADDDAAATPKEPTSCRRSARTRLPTPAAANKNQLGGPSFIPVVRRGMIEGAEPVMLKKSEAQELAGVTRANTRRNKGGARLPALRLKGLDVETSPGVKEMGAKGVKGAKKAKEKTVEWDQQLVYYHSQEEAVGEGGGKDAPPTHPTKNVSTPKDHPDEPSKPCPAPKLRSLKPPGLPIPLNATPAPKPKPNHNPNPNIDLGLDPPKPTPAPKPKPKPKPKKPRLGSELPKKKLGLGLGLGLDAGANATFAATTTATATAASASALGPRRKGKMR